jgi:hypothetical protein
MANVPSAAVPTVVVSTFDPGESARVPADLTLEQWIAMQQAAAVKLPRCTIALPCGTPGVNDEYAYTRAAPVNCPGCDWWMPVGTIRTQIRAFKVYWHISQLGDLRSPVTQTVPQGVVSMGARNAVTEAWWAASKAEFDRIATGIFPDAPFGKMGSGLPLRGIQLSINRFMQAMPDFVLSYIDQRVPVPPTEAELTQDGGVQRWRERGGFALYKPALEGRFPLTNVSLYACAEWCAGCPNPELWPGGTPTCVTSIKVETENFDWGMFVKREPTAYVVSISRLPKKTWDKIEDGIRTVTDQLDRFQGWMCHTYNSPAGQVAASVGESSTDPQTQLAARAFNTILRNGCGGQQSTGTQTTYDPANPPMKPQTAQSAGNRAIIAPLAPPPPSQRDYRPVFGLLALGLAAIGGAVYVRSRKRRRS